MKNAEGKKNVIFVNAPLTGQKTNIPPEAERKTIAGIQKPCGWTLLTMGYILTFTQGLGPTSMGRIGGDYYMKLTTQRRHFQGHSKSALIKSASQKEGDSKETWIWPSLTLVWGERRLKNLFGVNLWTQIDLRTELRSDFTLLPRSAKPQAENEFQSNQLPWYFPWARGRSK